MRVRYCNGGDLNTAINAGAPWEQMLSLRPLYQSDQTLHTKQACVAVWRTRAEPFVPHLLRPDQRYALECCQACMTGLVPDVTEVCWNHAIMAEIVHGNLERQVPWAGNSGGAGVVSLQVARRSYPAHEAALADALAANVPGPEHELATVILNWVRSTFDRYRTEVEVFGSLLREVFDAPDDAEHDQWLLFPAGALCRDARNELERAVGTAAVLWPSAVSGPDESWTVTSAPKDTNWMADAVRNQLVVPLGARHVSDTTEVWMSFARLRETGLNGPDALLAARAIALTADTDVCAA